MQNNKQNSFFVRFLSLFVVIFILSAAAVICNGKLWGNDFAATKADDVTVTQNDTLTISPDGSMVINTTYPASDVSGFRGAVPLKIYIDADGIITNIEALPNSETPRFFERASALLSEWEGKTVNEAQATDVDAVSGATFSSKAIIENVHRGLDYAQTVAPDKISAAKSKSSVSIDYYAIAAAVVALLGAVLPLFVKSKAWRDIQLALNVIVLGAWTGTFVSYALLIRVFSDGVNAGNVSALSASLIMVFVALVYPLFGRQGYYCANICPFGSAQELVGKITAGKLHLSNGVVTALTYFRNILWGILLVLLLTGVWTSWVDYELFTAFIYSSAPVWITVAALVFLVLSVFIPRPYCRFLCPTGAIIKG